MKKFIMTSMISSLLLTGCGQQSEQQQEDAFDYTVEQFADLQLLRFKVHGFEELPLLQKKLVYYLSEAALQGRDILFDQNGKYNLIIRKMLETVYTDYQGDRTDANFKAMETYLKRVWFSNGIHHHYAADKFVPGFTPEFFKKALESVDAAKLPLTEGEDYNIIMLAKYGTNVPLFLLYIGFFQPQEVINYGCFKQTRPCRCRPRCGHRRR